MKNRILCIFIFELLHSSLTFSQSNFWARTNGPFKEPYVYSMLITSTGTVLAGSGHGLFRSTDHGESFVSTLSSTTYALKMGSAGGVLAGTFGPGMYRSTDDGLTWSQINNGLTNTLIRTIAVSPEGNIFVGTSGGGIFRSTDEGANWIQLGEGLEETNVLSLAADSSGNIYAGIESSGVYRSTNEGESWIELNSGLQPSTSVWSFAFTSSNRILAGTDVHGLYSSTNGGETWTHTGLGGTIVSLATNRSGHIFIAGYEIVARSTNEGQSGILVQIDTDSVGFVRCFAIDSIGNVYAGTDRHGIYRSNDNGETWNRLYEAFAGTLVQSLVINSVGTVYAGTFDEGVFYSSDQGISWNKTNDGLTDTHVLSIALNSHDNLFVGSFTGVFYSSNGGINWSRSGLSGQYINTIIVHPNGSVFAGTSGSGIYRSTNSGTSWTETNEGLTNIIRNIRDIRSFAISSDGSILAGAGDGGVFRSTNNGLSWEPIGLTYESILSLAVSPTGHYFAGSYPGKLFQSTDEGTNWSTITNGLPPDELRCLAINSLGHIFVGARPSQSVGGVFRSVDDGYNWTPTNDGLTNSRVQALAIDSSGHIFAGTEGGGVFRSVVPTNTTLPVLAPLLSSPTDGATNVSTHPTLSWKASAGASSYRLQVSTDSSFSSLFFDANSITDTLQQVPDLAVITLYYWRVSAYNDIDTSSFSSAWSFTTTTSTSIENLSTGLPIVYNLYQNYPNPFNPSTTIQFSLPKEESVSLKVYDILGKEVATLISNRLQAGSHSIRWDARGMPSGVYFYRLNAGRFVETRKLLLLR